MRKILSGLFALVLVFSIGLTGCSADTASSTDGLTGNYRQDTLALISDLRAAINLPSDAPDKVAAEAEAKRMINTFASRYRRDSSVDTLSSFTTVRTALNALAGHYSSYPNRPIPQKLKTRLEQEFKQAEAALRRES
ncbi:MAG: photosystem II protein Psb27 [Leptolyngbyaceae cyanobacterium SM1_1_3]|nr:photosystem II protein Psb27 [Leptolyngbyaceae cyanobacterium SM1_1_3]NJM85377.1 photosystem II protein Psb27 [Leptolyngbyaceae cyanobacterium RM2_2_21]NJN03158.1 photosystem II protein Psb27 [Leptolyngbyaceae cyanobacterium RM1_1_2]NJO08919.1 photosystem II protein Psb27 [Leptolyngbyaceae cyanobacterium SL_1_1]